MRLTTGRRDHFPHVELQRQLSHRHHRLQRTYRLRFDYRAAQAFLCGLERSIFNQWQAARIIIFNARRDISV